MPSTLFSEHPLKKTVAKSKGLRDAVRKLVQAIARSSRSDDVRSRFHFLQSLTGDLHMAIGDEAQWWSVSGTTSRLGVFRIQVSFGRFARALREVGHPMDPVDRRNTRKLAVKVDRATGALGKAVSRLEKAVKSKEIRVVESHGRNLEGFILVREAMCTLDRDAAGKLSGAEVDRWCRWPRVDVEDSRQALRVAKLIWLSRLPDQIFGLAAQSDAPGRPLKLMRRRTEFPTEDQVRDLGHSLGGPMTLYVIAIKPTCRRAWTFYPDDVNWWE